MSWSVLTTDEKIAAIIAIYPDTAGTSKALSAGLSLQFGEVVTRNAVIGIYTRHGDKLKLCPLSGMTPEQKRALPAKPKPVRDIIVRVKPVKVEPPPVAPKDEPIDVLKPKPLNKTLLDLACDECKWPVNDGGPYLFCGHLRSGAAYCEYHEKLSVGLGTRSERMASRVAS